MTDTREPLVDRVPAPMIFLTAGMSQYFGAALAVGLFAVSSAITVAWARLAVSALLLVLLARPWQLAWTRRTLGAAVVFGLVLGGMNLLFYVAIDSLPLGATVAIEFTGPVAVAVLSATGRWGIRRLLPPLLAAAGVASISLNEVDWTELGAGSARGVLFALGAGAAWAGYMVLGRRIAARASRTEPAADGPGPLRTGLASLALALATATIVYAPLGVLDAAPLVAGWAPLLMVIGVGVLSSVIPYTLDQVAMKRLSTSTFALLNALLPASATLVGFLSLGQVPSGWELAGVAAISVAVALATRR